VDLATTLGKSILAGQELARQERLESVIDGPESFYLEHDCAKSVRGVAFELRVYSLSCVVNTSLERSTKLGWQLIQQQLNEIICVLLVVWIDWLPFPSFPASAERGKIGETTFAGQQLGDHSLHLMLRLFSYLTCDD
jgi:hypothetical protein